MILVLFFSSVCESDVFAHTESRKPLSFVLQFTRLVLIPPGNMHAREKTSVKVLFNFFKNVIVCDSRRTRLFNYLDLCESRWSRRQDSLQQPTDSQDLHSSTPLHSSRLWNTGKEEGNVCRRQSKNNFVFNKKSEKFYY